MDQYLKPTEFFDYESSIVQDFLKDHLDQSDTIIEKAIKIYNAVRDSWFYTSSTIFFKKKDWIVSEIMKRPKGHCIDKSSILIACLRAIGIPARLHLAKVRNHIAAEKLIESMGTDELTPHGMVDLYLNDQWLKVSPAFNKELCDKLNVGVLEFDGERNSLFQEFDKTGGQFMEYLVDYGHFDDVPLSFIYQNMKEHYKGLSNFVTPAGVVNI